MTTVTVNLDDITKTSFCIPFKKPANTNRPKPNAIYRPRFPSTPHPSRDLPDPISDELRFEAYRLAWGRCLTRMQEIVTNLQKSTIDEVVNSVKDSDPISKNARAVRLPGLPFPELPVIAVINPAFGPLLLHRIITELETETDAMDTDMDDAASVSSASKHSPPCLVTHFRAVDFPNITSAMKAVISGFVDKAKEKGLERGEKKGTAVATSLAAYDIRYLEAWYRTLTSPKGKGKEVPSKLVVILHDFEQFDSCVMQEVFYICSQSSPSVPLTFILSLTSPLPNFLNTVYPASTLSLVRARTITAPYGAKVLNEILRKTFFVVDFDPDVVIGPTALEFLQDSFTRHHSSIDVILTVVQLVHLKHFTSDPVTVLVHSTPPAQLLTQHGAANFVKSIQLRLALDSSLTTAGNGESRSTAGITEAVDKARGNFHSTARIMRVGFGVMCLFQVALKKLGYKGLEWASEGEGDVGVDVMLDLLRGRLGRDLKQLGTIVKKLKIGELECVLDKLITYFFDLPAHTRVRTEEQEARTRLIMLRSTVSQDGEPGADVAAELAAWLKEYLSNKLRPLEELDLWDVWYTRNTPSPSELLNVSVRACVVTGLLSPYEYTKEFSAGASESASGSKDEDNGKRKSRAMWKLPDTSILFKRYLDSGRMINVFDWFDSFKGVLEVQRKCRLVEGGEVEEASRSPRKNGGKRKSKGKGKKENKEAMEIEGDEDEEWKLEVQARFIRALHELDYLGLVKHTGRKKDHVQRTLFDVVEEEEEDSDDD